MLKISKHNNYTNIYILLLAVISSIVGALPHFAIEWQATSNTLFQGAWDETFYFLTLFGKIPEWNNYPLKNVLQITIDVLNLDILDIAFWFDVIFPFMTVLIAGQLATLLVTKTHSTLLLAFFLVFGSEIFNLNSSLFTVPMLDLKTVISGMDLNQKKYFLDTYSTFFSIYRTPEPQLSYVIFLCFVLTLIRFYQADQSKKSIIISFYALSIISTVIYPFFAIASIGLNAICIISVALEKKYNRLGHLVFIVLLSSALILFTMSFYYSKEANATIFQTRLPLTSMSLIYSVIFLVTVMILKRTRFLSICNFALFPYLTLMFPLIVLNQQIFTGYAVQAVNWERYINIPVLIVSVVLISKQVKTKADFRFESFSISSWSGHTTAFGRLINPSILFMMILLLSNSQFNNYRQWIHYNILTETYGVALRNHNLDLLADDAVIILKDMSSSPAIRVRSGITHWNVKGYDWIISNSFGSSENHSGKLRLEAGFQFASRLGFTADQYLDALVKELDSNSCWPHMMYIASFLECAPYVSDFRNYNKEKLKILIYEKALDYEAYLDTDHVKNGYLLSTGKLKKFTSNDLWVNILIFETKLSLKEIPGIPTPNVSVFLYRQEPK